MDLNGNFLMPPERGPRPAPAPRPRPAPEALLAESLRGEIDRLGRVGRLTASRRRALVRDHGIALATLCGMDGRELARDHHLHHETVSDIVRRLCRGDGIAARGADSDG